jgi:type I restriction enzyme S subunit
MASEVGSMREGYKMTELGEIPVEWEEKKLGDIAEVCYGKNQKDVERDNGRNPILGTGGVIGHTDSFLYDQPSVLIGRKGTIYKPIYIDIPFWTVDTLFYTRVSAEVSAKWFYYSVANTDLMKYNEATGVPSLNSKTISSILYALPPLPEQRAIADFLSTVDERIDQTDALIEKTQLLKKGLMQRLLTRGIGHTEFKMTELGEIPVEWEVVDLDSISTLITKGSTPTTYGFEYVNIGINFIKNESISEEQGTIDNRKVAKIDLKCHETFRRSQLHEGDILFGIAGALGRCTIIPSYILPANTNQALSIIRLKSDILRKYVYFQLVGPYIRANIDLIKTSTAQANLNLDQILHMQIPFPPLPEQRAIADILTSVDDRIDAYQTELARLNLLKKGLMQQLLTGRKRIA